MERPGKEIADELRRIDLFTALDSRQLRIVIDNTRVIRLDDGERLFDHGQPARQFFHLRTGQLKLFRSSPSGGEKIIEIVQPKETFAQAVMFMEPSGGYPVSAEALAPSVLLGFDNEVMRGVLRESVDTCFRVFASMSRRLRQQVDEIERLTLHPAVSRLAGYLVAQASSEVPQSCGIHLTAPKNVIASRLGIQPETFSRVDQHDRRGVVDEVRVVGFRLAAEEHRTDLPGELRELTVVSGHAEERRPERRHVARKVLDGVAGRIDGYQYMLPGCRHVLGQVMLDPAQRGEGGRADVGAMGVAEEHERPCAVEVFAGERLAVMVLQRERPDRAGIRPQHARQRRMRGRRLAPRSGEPQPSSSQTKRSRQNQQGGAMQPDAPERWGRSFRTSGIDPLRRHSRGLPGRTDP